MLTDISNIRNWAAVNDGLKLMYRGEVRTCGVRGVVLVWGVGGLRLRVGRLRCMVQALVRNPMLT
jgi:hypothetical protein